MTSRWPTVQGAYELIAAGHPKEAQLLIDLAQCAVELDELFDKLKDEIIIEQFYRINPAVRGAVDHKRANLRKVLGIKARAQKE